MRFLSDGPNIPNTLLEARDEGEVVFLCGAGVSRPAGMPDFLKLTNHVVDRLHASQVEEVSQLLSYWCEDTHPEIARPPLDEIFNLLQRKYNASDVDYFIADRLKTECETCVSKHRTILRLSKGGDGKPRVVTTNFDRLFEVAEQEIPTYAPPVLPDLAAGQKLNGLVYLHGRIDPNIKRGEARQELVVSSSDFGRAYLVEGWATRFLRELLRQYNVVLLGYSASDPPVRYLLQGLYSMGLESRKTIYAFAEGSPEEVEDLWSDRGVQAIAYASGCNDHSALWDSLEAWAQCSDDPLAWRRQVIELARRGPRNLKRHERGQVTSLVRTVDGAELFAEADPPLPGEWLCVFDSTVRHGKVEQDFLGLQPDFDPLQEFGLDDDISRPQENRSVEIPLGDDFLSLRDTDPHKNGYMRLAGMPHYKDIPLSDRLSHVAKWIVRIAHEPVAPWWAARYVSLHTELLRGIEYRLENNRADFPSLALSTWNLLIEKFRATPDHSSVLSWYEASKRIDAEGWTNSVLRAFERSVTPHLTTEPSFGHYSSTRPPEKDWSELQLTDLAQFDVIFPKIHDKISRVTEEVLPEVYKIVRTRLELGRGLLEDLGASLPENPTLYPNGGEEEDPLEDSSAYFLWFRDLLDQMAELHPEVSRSDIALWPKEAPYFFNKLRLYAWSFKALFTGDEAGDGLLTLSDKTFWDPAHRRELLHLLRQRWQELSLEKRRLLEQHIIQGPPKWRTEQEEDYKKRRSLTSATILGWLINCGCVLSEDAHSVLPELRNANPLWHSDLDKNADEPYGVVTGGWITIDRDPSVLLDVPPSQVISLAQENTMTSYEDSIDYQPFDGLVEKDLDRAIAALRFAGEKGEYPREYWQSLLENWPETTNHRLIGSVGETLMQLPSEVIEKFRYQVFYWLKRNLPELAKCDLALAYRIFDNLLNKLLDGGEDATRSGIGEVRAAGDNHGWSRRTMIHAFNSVVGMAIRLVLDILESQNLEEGVGIPPEIRARLERLMDAPGEGTDHAACIISHHVEWLHYLDPEWACSTIVPWFDPGHQNAEPAWNGFLHRRKLPIPGLFSQIRNYFLDVFSHVHNWKWNDRGLRVLHEFLVCGCLWHKYDEVYFTYSEVHRALQQTDDSGRSQSIEYLTKLIQKNHASWQQFGQPFLDKAWPRETSFQTEETSLNLAILAVVTGDSFPDALQVILPLLGQINRDNWFLYRVMTRGGGKEYDLPTQFPMETLALINNLVPDNPPKRLIDLDLILEKITEANPSLRQDSRWQRLKGIARRE